MKKLLLFLPAFILICSTSFGQITVTGCTGAGNGSYTTLGAAITAIGTAQAAANIVISVSGNTTEGTGTITIGIGTWTTMKIQPSGGSWTITAATTAGNPMIAFAGADNVTIDGLNTGGNYLTISNTTASATTATSTIRFIGGATSNTITNCSILGSFSAAVGTNGGNIFFSTDAVTANGNDNNTVSFCNIGPAGSNLPTKCIYMNGSTTTPAIGNSGNTFNSNNIYDYFGAAVTSAGIYISGGNTDNNITNNKFYQSATRTQTTGAQHSAIWIANASGNNFLMSGNTIGYASNTGTGMYTFVGVSSSSLLIPVFINVGTTTATSLQGNTIAGIAMSGAVSGTSTSSPFRGIYVASGLTTIGNVTGNTIGSMTLTGSITFTTSSSSSSDVIGMFNFGSSAWTTSNNNIGGISVSNSSTGAANFYGLRCNTGSGFTWLCNTNTIGGDIANSINSTSTATGTIVNGILNSNPSATMTGNTIRNMNVAGGTGTGSTAAMVGIAISASSANHTLSQNIIYNLTSSSSSTATYVHGINFNSSTGTNLIARNFIHSLNNASATGGINGIYIIGGTATYQNNMIRLGIDGSGSNITTACAINGINESVSGIDNFYFNSVYIGGAGVGTTTSNTFAFNSSITLNTRNFRDNIFMNTRSNATTGGKHYAVQVGGAAPNPSGLTIDYNIYLANGTGGVFGRFNALDVANLAAWKTAVGQDANSWESNPQFLVPNGTSATVDLHINPSIASAVESKGVVIGAITDDFDGQTRADLTPVDIGADALNGTPLPTCSGPPAASSILGASSVCTGTGTTLSLSTTYSDIGIGFQWSWGTTPGGPYPNALGTGATQATGNLTVPTYFICTITCLGVYPFTTAEKAVGINALPTVGVLPLSALYCTPGGSPVTLTASGATTYSWSPASGLDATTGSVVHASPASTTPYVVTGTDGNGCTNTATSTITVGASVFAAATATPPAICTGSNSQLLATASQAFTPSAPSAYGFAGSSVTYTVITGTTLGSDAIGDDKGIGNLPIGFNFNYNGANHTIFGARSNGLIELDQANTLLSGFSINALASTANCIAPLWDDNNTTGGSIIYATTGSVGSRVLTVQWTGMHVGGAGSGSNPTIDMQLKLYETSNIIEFIYGTTSAAFTSTTASIGISGTVANFLSVTPLNPVNTSTASNLTENASISSATNFPTGTKYTFTPSGSPTFSYAWSPTTFIPAGQETTANPLATALNATTIYSVTVTGVGGCASTTSATVTVASNAEIGTQPAPSVKCTGQTATFTVAATGPSLTYKWRKGGTEIDRILNPSAGTNTLSLSNVSAPDEATYDVIVEASCGFPVTSDGATLTVKPLPTVQVTPASASYCIPGGSAVTLTATGASTYAWSPALGLDATTGDVVHASPAATTTYTVTGTGAFGCTNTASAVITVGAAVTMNSVSALPPAVCFGESTVLTALASLPAPSSYCTASATSTLYEKISNVTLNALYNTSSATAGYEDFTALSTALVGGTGYPVSISVSSAYASDDRVYIWIDMDHDGVFANPGEKVYDAAVSTFCPTCSGTAAVLTGTVTVPVTAINGPTRMRIRLQDNGSTPPNTTPCGTSAYGQVEDYTVIISGGANQPFNYTWSENPSSGTLSSTTLNPTSALGITVTETYSVTATSQSGCAATGSVIVTAGALLTAAATADPATPVCAGTLVTLTGTPTGGGGPYTYSWKVGGLEVSTLQIYEVNPVETTTYNLTITDNCAQVANALPVTVTVIPLPTSEVSPAGTVNVCVPNTQLLSGTTSASSPTYQWQLNGLDIHGATDVTYTVTGTGVYSLVATDGTTGCVETSSEVTVNINPLPSAFTITPNAPVVQAGGVQQLTASNSVVISTLLNEDFNGSVPGWTTVNASTGGTPAAAAWMLYTSSPTFYSNDNTNFILSNSDGQGSGSTTRTQLISPVINTTGYSNLALNFWHIFKIADATDIGKIEVSIDGGSNWISPALKAYTTNQGTETAWVPATVDLSAYINQTNLKIRFNYYATWGYYWGIDNLSITSSAPATITWSPNTYLYTDADTTTRYTNGDPAQTVFTRPRGNITYTATATSAAGCTTTQTVIVTSCPEAPGPIAPSNITTTSFDLNWEYLAGGQQPSGYNILVATDSEFGDIFGDFTVANSVFTQSVTVPEGNTEYFYKIIANGAAGCDRLSITGSVITCPSVPFDPASSDNKTDGFTISWTPPDGGKASPIIYSIDVATNDAFTPLVNHTVAAPDLSLVLTGLVGNTEYFYRIKATNGCESEYTETASAITCAAVPGVPVVSYIAPDGFTLTWTAPAGGTASAISYSVEVADNPSFTGAVITPVAASVVTLTVTGLYSSTLYYYRIKAIGVCAGDFTTPGSVSTLCTPAVAPFIEDFELAEFAPNCWTNSAVAGSFVWERTTKASGNGGGSGSALANFFNQTDGTYELTTKPFDITGLTTPTLKFNYAYATYVVEIDELDVYYSTNYGETWIPLLLMPGGPFGILNTAGSTFDEFIPTASQWCTQSIPLEPGTNMVKFVATSAYGNNLYLDNICVADPVGMDLTLADVTVTGNVAYQAANNIDVAGGTTYFIVENSGSATIIAGNRISFGPGTRVDAGGYLHGYISYDMDCSLVKAPTIPTIISGNGENSFDIGKTAITLYPNPTSGNFTLVQKGDKLFGNVNIEVYNIQGEKVMTDQMVGEKKRQFNFADMPVGLYFVKVVAGDYVETIKLVKTR
ncbi:MAG: fibronectin type III domain-containing protein [Bacteroidetes bacterium]|nr:fibronectin type III domain-containing protein [Bacteroidota bacterium]